jgi:hypothetical protein
VNAVAMVLVRAPHRASRSGHRAGDGDRHTMQIVEQRGTAIVDLVVAVEHNHFFDILLI